MIRIEKYNSNYSNQWNDFIKKSKNGIFLFDRNFMEYHSDRFKDCSFLFFDDDKLIAILPANIKGNVLFSHQGLTYGGFITDSNMKQYKMNECFGLLLEYMASNNILKLIYKPLPYIYTKIPSEEAMYALFLNNANLLWIKPATVIDLSNPCKMPKGKKAQISRAKREGVIIENSCDFVQFINLENEVLKKYHNTKAVHNAQELELLKSFFNDEIQLFIAKHNGEVIAAALLFVYNDVVHTQYLAANEKAREIGALDFLIATLIDKYRNEKRYFDFGTSTEANEKILNTGLIAQKEGFGGRSVAYYCWEVNINE